MIFKWVEVLPSRFTTHCLWNSITYSWCKCQWHFKASKHCANLPWDSMLICNCTAGTQKDWIEHWN
jgi:hypothetical protein